MICVNESIPDHILTLNEMNWHPIVNQTTTQFELAFKNCTRDLISCLLLPYIPSCYLNCCVRYDIYDREVPLISNDIVA